ncbi:MAG: ubiquinol-cytochrome c reductase iron-sulfur subunit [Myxococcales bacterium]|nr:ubiquinol-cytochrome c reductase iron-sulfur subunit [Myxococcales bacterium]
MGADEPEGGQPRRDFLNLAISGTAAALGVMAVYPVGKFLTPRDEAGAKTATLGEVERFLRGTAKTVLVGDRPALVLRLDDGSFRAFSALCTHLQCVVAYAPERKQIECPCHRGVYSVEGQNVSGPPPKPLDTLAVAVVNGIVTVSEA